MKLKKIALLSLLAYTTLASCRAPVDPNIEADSSPVVLDLSKNIDDKKVLKNPNKGIYQHYYDNTNSDAYYGGSEEEILSIPGINHLFIRMAWSFLEIDDGIYEWSYIDNLLETYKKHNITVSIDITTKETMGHNTPAVPKWLIDKGVEGEYLDAGYGDFLPDYNGKMFLKYLERFHHALNEHIKDETHIENITIGSIGDWGEGHSGASGNKKVPLEVIKKHVDLYRKCYPNFQIVIGDDYLAANLNKEEENELLEYLYENKIGMRDDSILYYHTANQYEDSVKSPHYFKKLAPVAPTTIETEHYGTMLETGKIQGPDGKVGRKELLGAIDKIKATYFSFHGGIWQWLVDNPNLTKEIANKVGYWYFMKSITRPKEFKSGQTSTFKFDIKNNGVARAYNDYDLVFSFTNGESKEEIVVNANNTEWLPGDYNEYSYEVTIPSSLKADYYHLNLKLHSSKLNRPVYFALNEEISNSEGVIDLGEVIVR